MESLNKDVAVAMDMESTGRVVIAATFTADSLIEPLRFWLNTLSISQEVRLAPYAQVLQLLLDPRSEFATNTAGCNVTLLRVEDWIRDRSHEVRGNLSCLRSMADEFIAAMEAFRARSSTPVIVFFCPTSVAMAATYGAACEELRLDLERRLAQFPRIRYVQHAELVRLYPVVAYEDARADRVGHIPYQEEYFVALATLLARRVSALLKQRHKVIALDCDNTLWQGICGEDGPDGIVLTPAHRQLQQLLVRQYEAGVLLCLCSKNNPADVDAVFAARLDMPLRPEHLVAARVNWEAKSSNLRELARELDLALDSFVFIDDSELECAEVSAHCSEVLALHIPRSSDGLAHFLDHAWILDAFEATKDAQRRTEQYKVNRARREAREQAPDLERFLASLQLHVGVEALEASQLDRVAELIQRTNQFNLTTIRRSAGEIAALVREGRLEACTVHVRDRFGDYGLVGAVLYGCQAPALIVDTFVLSCRVLGRGVEHRIVNALGHVAGERGLAELVFPFRGTARNQPASTFLDASFTNFRRTADTDANWDSLYRVPTEFAKTVAYRPTLAEVAVSEQPEQPEAKNHDSGATLHWHQAAYRLSRIDEIVKCIRRSTPRLDPGVTERVVPRTPLEATVASLWADVLGTQDISVRADFFALGGDSLKAVRLISRVEATLGKEFDLYQLFAGLTIEEMASELHGASTEFTPIPVADRSLPIPLLPAQQRLWFIDQLEGGSAAYHIVEAIRLRGELDRLALQQSFDALLLRHEALRSVASQSEDRLYQRISPDTRCAIKESDISVRPDTRLKEILAEEFTQPFDLSSGPLIRARLLKVEPREHVLVITLHHMISDGWSIGVLINDMSRLYAAAVSGEPDPLPPLRVQYADYAQWLAHGSTGVDIERQLAYWAHHLQGAPDLLELPTDRPRPAVQSYRGAAAEIDVGEELTAQLQELSGKLQLTVVMPLCAAWVILLSRLSGQQEIVTGIPVANRRRSELEGLIGYFVNTLPVRVRVADDLTITDVLHQVKAALLGAYANQDAPFDRIVDTVQPARSLSHNPLYQVMFVLQNTPRDEPRLPGLTASPEPVPVRTAQFDLVLSLQQSGARLLGVLNYATDLFDAVTLQRWAGYFKAVLSAIATRPQLRISEVPLMSEAELRQVIDVFNATSADFPDKLMHQFFEEQVERTPGATAVVCSGDQLSYAQLNAKANRLAIQLCKHGIVPDDRVGIFAERGVDLIVGMLAVCKAGAAYLPLDVTYPEERIAYMIRDSAPVVLLTQRKFEARFDRESVPIVLVDDDDDVANVGEPWLGNPVVPGLRTNHLAYVIYTSGSTGAPKGVLVEHRSVANLIDWHLRAYGLSSGQRSSCVAAIGFDAAVWEIWPTLASGATLVLSPVELIRDPQGFLEWWSNEALDLSFLPTPVAELVFSRNLAHPRLRTLLIGGDRLRALPPRTSYSVINNYGPTEATVVSTCGRVDDSHAAVHIGRPIGNMRCYILDRNFNPVPIGVAGELYIGGAGVARGYWQRPDLQSARFVRDPWSSQPGARLYRTGDVVRWRPDGNIEFLGRNDEQVKIRGYRIELGEIEAQLARHPHVKEAAVIARADGSAEKRLHAYMVCREDAAVSSEQLRAFLREILPEYMLPSAFMTLSHLPLTANGKLDRRALPEPDVGAYVRGAHEAPHPGPEEVVASIWQELLGIQSVGRHDNFFELGGHSLLVVQLLECLRQAGFTTQVRRVFESPTVARLASTLGDAAQKETPVPDNLILPDCRRITPNMLPLVQLTQEQIEKICVQVPGGVHNIQDIYPLAPLQEGILFHNVMSQQEGDSYVAATLLIIESRRRVDELIVALQTVIDRHDALRSAVLWESLPSPVQVVYRKAQLPVERVTLDSSLDAFEQARTWLNPSEQRMNLQQAPLLRLRVAEAADERYHVLLQTHHIVGDNTSRELVISEVAALLENRARELPQPVPYRRHVAQVLTQAQQHDATQFFSGKLGEVTEPTAPFGLLDVHGGGNSFEEARHDLDARLAQSVRAQARRLGVSTATIFHAAWGLVVAHTTGRDDVVFGSVLLGRLQGDAGAQRVLGMFINTLPLRLQLQGISAAQLIEHCRQELVDLLSYEQSSLAEAQRCSGISGSAPLFTALLNYRHGGPGRHTDWGAIDGISVVSSLDLTNYPLTLSVDDLDEGFTLTAQTDRRIQPERLNSYLQTALASLIDALERRSELPVLELPLLPEAERRRVMEEFNATGTEYRRDGLIHELFEQQVRRTPEAIALSHGEVSLTYAQLNAQANGLARELRARGIGPDQLVGICLDRGSLLVVGLLGILKAGGAYLPLDPNYPRERLQHMLSDALPTVVLTEAKLRAMLPPTDAAVMVLESSAVAAMTQEAADPAAEEMGLSGHHLLYVIYTSGSTGRPKGTMMTHGAMVNLIEWQRRELPGEGQRVLQFAALSFDVAFQETFTTLCTGGTLVLLDEWLRKDAQALLEFLGEKRIERLFVPPLLLQSLAECQQGDASMKLSLRDVITAGEQLRITKEIVSFFERLESCRLHNHYGPTETHVVTSLTLSREASQWPAFPTIGRPIANTKIYVLSEQRQPVPIGVAGEVYIGGANLARGYLGREDLTRQRFVEDPFAKGERLYRTGDLGRWRADGTVEYLGRNDDQVKIRGYRIELGEIEARLSEHAAVKEVAVIARQDVPGDKRLVAYIVWQEAAAADAEALRGHLQAALPEHMVPAAFVSLERLPLSPNGKLDRRVLPAPAPEAYASRRYEAPQGEVEQLLSELWQELLHVPQVGRNDNFFELGGHSLLMIQMMARVRRAGLAVDVRNIYTSRSLAELAETIQGGRHSDIEIPSNVIPEHCGSIAPKMLPLIDLSSTQIERIAAAVPGGAANIQDIYPLVALQEGILFHHLLHPEGGDAYVRPMLLKLSSRERLDELSGALQLVIDRHDVLRTAILWEDLPQPVQVVYRQAPLRVTVVQSGPLGAREQLKELMRPERQRLELRQAPLMHLYVSADVAGEGWYVLLQTHHLICDNEALTTLLSEVIACLDGRAHELPQPLPYRNHVAHSLAHARSRDAEKFFRRKLGDVDEPTAPFGLLDVRADSIRLTNARLAVDQTLARRTRAVARRASVSTATLFHAAWAMVVAHTSGRDDVVYGTVLVGRLQGTAGGQPTLGMFINTLPLRLRLRGIGALELVKTTQQEVVELLDHEQASLALAQRCSGVSGSTPLFGTLINYLHSAVDLEAGFARAPGITLLESQGGTNYPIVLSINDLGEDFLLGVESDGRVEAGRLTQYLHTALESLVTALEMTPHAQAMGLTILPPSERRHLLESHSAGNTAPLNAPLIHKQFSEQARQTPDAPAVVCEDMSLSYNELELRTNQLARSLVDRGVGPDVLVALCVERGVDLLVGVLGILKAGGAYLPLDPEYPAERLMLMLEEASPRVLVTQRRLVKQLPQTHIEIIALDGDWTTLIDPKDRPLETPATGVADHHLAYVIYTSGSTGRPKGVMIEHRQVVNLALGLDQIYQQLPRCRSVALNASLNFDASVQQLIQVAFGRTLYVVPQRARLDARVMLEFLRANQIEAIDCTPSQLRSWVGAGLLNSPSLALRLVLVGGEALDAALWERLASCPFIAFFNVYGPTECTVDSTAGLLTSGASPHIGKPMLNRRIYILNSFGQLVPEGVAGEIYIGGEGIGRGYLRRVQLTAEAFVCDTAGGPPGGRMYRTGDLGRWHADGTIEYLGRNDHQVKLRGFRMELGEISSQLLRHPDVTEAAVIVREDTSGDRRLVAYVVPAASANTSTLAETLRATLKRALPEPMIPAAFVGVPHLPMTPSGKLDRASLPAPGADAYAKAHYEAPVGEVETLVASLWQDLLGVDQVGRNDNFFELGGHSLHAMKITGRMSERFQVSLSVALIFQFPTVARLAEAIAGRCSCKTQDVAIAVRPSDAGAERTVSEYAPLTFQQRAHWNLYRLSGHTAVRQIVSAIRLRGPLDVPTLQLALNALMHRHQALRTRIVVTGGDPSLLIVAPFEWPLVVEDLSSMAVERRESEALRRMSELATESIDPRADPLVDFRVFRLQADEHVLYVSMEHMISDAVSVSIFWRDLFAVYASGLRHTPPNLPPIEKQLSDYALEQVRSHPAWLERHGAYWQEFAAGDPRIRMPVGPVAATIATGWARAPFALDEVHTEQLRAWCRSQRTTLVMGMLTAYAALVMRWIDTPEVVIQFQIDGRGDPKIANTMGYLASVLYLKVGLQPGDRFMDLLLRVVEAYWCAHEHADNFYLETQEPRPAFATTCGFNWIHAGESIDVAGLAESASALEITPLRVAHLAAEKLVRDNDPVVLLSEAEGKILGDVYYPAQRFSASDMQRFGEQFRTIVERLLSDPELPIGLYPSEQSPACVRWVTDLL